VQVRSYIFFLIFSISIVCSAQDIHFSQFNGSLLNLSPGFTGFFDGDYRVGAIYRSQWHTVPVKYSTFSMNGEARLKPRQLEKDNIGVGVLFNSDRAGAARYGTTQLYFSGSYIWQASKDSSLIVTLGTNVGWCQVGFDYTKMTFDNHFDGYQYNKALASGEQFNWVQRSFFDLNLGTVVRYIHNRKHSYTYGLGVYHVTSPVISYQGNDISKLDYKMSHYLSYQGPLNYYNDIIIEALYNSQGKNYEVIPHISLKHYLKKEESQAISAGAAFRARDAVIVRLGYFYRSMQSGIAYDINFSNFNAASNRRGGFEIFINYLIKVKPAFVAKKRPCPLFI
jgi:type IX secretion system PorP/SprF family membrane protein